MSLIDLQTHSTASDGTLTPSQIVLAARESGIEILSLTDHDTLEGIDEAVEEGLRSGVKVVNGIELSVQIEDGSIHLLGYGFNRQDIRISETLTELVESRNNRNLHMVERLNRLGYRITMEDVARHSRDGVIGRPHMALALLHSGKVRTVNEAFTGLLNEGGAAYVDRKRLTLKDACDMLHNAGGVAVWAHPGLFRRSLPEMLEGLPGWVAQGLDGIESDYGGHTLIQRNMIRSRAIELGMIYTGGSDFHGAIRPNVKLGDGPEGEAIDYECWLQLEKRLNR